MEPRQEAQWVPASETDGLAGRLERRGECVDELVPGMRGRWEVASRGSVHVWDLDLNTYMRLPGRTAQAMTHDGVELPIGRVGAWPRVGGRSLIFFDDPDDAQWEHWRVCSQIRTITRLPGRDTEPPGQVTGMEAPR